MAGNETCFELQKSNCKESLIKKLIRNVKKHPALWNRLDRSHKDKETRSDAWTDICRNMETRFDQLDEMEQQMLATCLMKKWYNIRDNFGKYVKNRPGTRYIYADELEFLDPIYRRKKKPKNEPDTLKSESNYDIDEDEFENNEFTNNPINDLNEIYLETPEYETPSKVPRLVGQSTVNESLVAVVNSLIDREDDEDRAFFKSITPTVKKLSPDDKIEFRIEVLKLLKRFSEDK